ncbi:unnamed protein product, partial [Closterium sp. NIES-53]
FGDEAERPRWSEFLRSGVDIFALDYDAILAAMYALFVSAEGDCCLCVPPDPSIEAAALGASESSLPGNALAEALHTFTLESGASRCFFRDSTTLTPLPAPVPVRLADPSGRPVLARSSTVLPCLAVPSGSLSGLHLPPFSTNLVSTDALQDVMVTTTTPGGQRVSICTCTRTGRHLATFTRRPGSSLYTLTTEPPHVVASAQVSASGPVSASPPALSCPALPSLHRMAAPRRSSFPPTSAPFYRLFPYRTALLPPPPLFLAPSPPPVDPFPPQGPAPSGAARGAASGGDASGGAASGGAASRGAEPASAEPGGAEPEGAEHGGAESEGAESGGGEPEGTEPEGAELGGAESEGAESGGAEPRGTTSAGGPAGASPRLAHRREPLSPQQLREWFAKRTRVSSKGCSGSSKGCSGNSKGCSGSSRGCSGSSKGCSGSSKGCSGSSKGCSGNSKGCSGRSKGCSGCSKGCSGNSRGCGGSSLYSKARAAAAVAEWQCSQCTQQG